MDSFNLFLGLLIILILVWTMFLSQRQKDQLIGLLKEISSILKEFGKALKKR